MLKRLFHRSKIPVHLILSAVVVATVVYNGCSSAVRFESGLNGLNGAQSVPTGAIQINKGVLYTNTTNVNITVTSSGASQMYLTNDSSCSTGGSWQPIASNASWVLGQTNQQALVYAKFMSSTQVQSPCVNASIINDEIPPTVVVDQAAALITNVNNVSIKFHATDSLSGVNELLCIMPGQSAMIPCTGLYSGNALADGNYLVQLAASDNAGNVSVPMPQNFMVDTTPPTITLNSYPSNPTASTIATFGFIATDNLSGVAGYFCSLDNATPYTSCVSGVNFGGLAQGAHSFAVHAIDNAGNVSTDATYKWTIDSSVPTVQFTQTPKAITNTLAATFAFTGQDDKGNALTVFQCRLNGSPFASCTSPDVLSAVVAGNNTFGIRGQDVEGVYSAELDYTWLVDMIAPVVTITSYPPPLTNSNNSSFTFTATDAGGSGIATVMCVLDGGAATNCATMSEAYTSLPGNTQHTFQVIATDNAGNTGASTPYVWYIDNTPPDLKIVSAPAVLSPTDVAQFQILATDAYGPITYTCGLDSSATLTTCGTTINYANLTNGAHTFYAQAQDAAGNLSSVISYTWTVETIGPVITFTQTPGSTLVDTNQGVLTYTITDSYSTVTAATCVLDSTSLTPCSLSGATLTFPLLPDGTHTFTLTATNAAGYSSNKPYTFTVVAPNIITYPTIGSVAAVAWEDLYGSGSPDYDYNDFLTEFQVTEKVNSNDQITDIYLDFYPRAVGGGYDHSLVLALSGKVTTAAANNTTASPQPTTAPLFNGAANIDITYYDGSGNVLSQQASAPYNNQDVVVFSSTHAAFGVSSGITDTALPSGYVWGSGTPSNYIKATQNARIHLSLASPAANPTPANGQFNIATLRMVLHVKNTNENIDIINVVPSNFTSGGLPWGFVIPTDWQWMQEGVNINKGYPNLANYAAYLLNPSANASCLTTPTCINWYNYPVAGAAAQQYLYPVIHFVPILPAP